MQMRTALVILSWCAAPLAAQSPVITVSSAGLSTVHHTVALRIPAGRSTHRVALGEAIAGSIQSATDGVRIVEVRREPQFTEADAFKAAIGRTFEFADWPPRSPAKLLALNPERWEFPRPGQVMLGRPGAIIWPADLVMPDTGLVITLESDRARESLALDYEVAGGSWTAIYDLRLGERGTLSGTAVVATGELELATATTRLLAGDIGPHSRPLPRLRVAANAFEDASITTGASSAEFGNAQGGVIGLSARDNDSYSDGVPVAPVQAGQIYVYQLPGHLDFAPDREIAVPLLPPTAAVAQRRFTIGSSLPFRGGVGPDGEERRVPVMVNYEVSRPRGTPLGDLPLPGGVISVQVVGADGIPRLTGRSTIGHLAPGAPLRVGVGASFDLTATRIQTAYTVTDTNQFRQPSAADISYRVTIRNAGDTASTVTVYEARAGEWSVINSSHPADRRSSTVVAFTVSVPPRGESTLTYRLRVVW
jgi:hypothetical protein